MVSRLIPVLCVALAGCLGESTAPASFNAPAAATDDAPLALDERFQRVAFVNEYGVNDLVRWEHPIRYTVEGASSSRTSMIEDQLSILARLTGLSISRMSPGQRRQANAWPDVSMVIHFVTFAEMDRHNGIRSEQAGLMQTAVSDCVFDYWYQDRRKIQILIRRDLGPAQTRLCIVQETAQVMGLFGDTDGRSDTAFASGTGADNLTAADRAMLRILYDDRMRPGMTEREAMPIVRQIVAEMEATEEAGNQ